MSGDNTVLAKLDRMKLFAGFLTWLATALGALSAYLLTLQGDLSLWSWGIVLTGAAAQVSAGIGLLATYVAKVANYAPPASRREDDAPVPTQEPVALEPQVITDLTWNDPILARQLKVDEGVVMKVYADPVKPDLKTAGIGHLLTAEDGDWYDASVGTEIPESQILQWFDEDRREAFEIANRRFSLTEHPIEVQRVIVNLTFQLGEEGLFGDPEKGTVGFDRTLRLLRQKQYAEAGVNLRSTLIYKQAPVRMKRHIATLTQAG